MTRPRKTKLFRVEITEVVLTKNGADAVKAERNLLTQELERIDLPAVIAALNGK